MCLGSEQIVRDGALHCLFLQAVKIFQVETLPGVEPRNPRVEGNFFFIPEAISLYYKAILYPSVYMLQ